LGNYEKVNSKWLLKTRKWLLRGRFLRGRGWLYKPSFEKHVKRRLREVKGDVFWDIGAHMGFYSLMMRRNFGRVVAVEPNPETAATLRERTRAAGNIEVLEIALSNINGSVPLYTQKEKFSIPGIYNKFQNDSLLAKSVHKSARDPSTDRVVENRPSIQVSQRRFDEMSAGPVDLVKIDVEGAEFLVLDGMRDSLKDGLVKRIMLELHNREDKTKLESLFAAYGYAIEWVDLDHLFASVRQTMHQA